MLDKGWTESNNALIVVAEQHTYSGRTATKARSLANATLHSRLVDPIALPVVTSITQGFVVFGA